MNRRVAGREWCWYSRRAPAGCYDDGRVHHVNVSPRFQTRAPAVAGQAISSCLIVSAALDAALKRDPTHALASRELQTLKG